jgi:hypothetical protein
MYQVMLWCCKVSLLNRVNAAKQGRVGLVGQHATAAVIACGAQDSSNHKLCVLQVVEFEDVDDEEMQALVIVQAGKHDEQHEE